MAIDSIFTNKGALKNKDLESKYLSYSKHKAICSSVFRISVVDGSYFCSGVSSVLLSVASQSSGSMVVSKYNN